MLTAIAYNKTELKTRGTKDDIKDGYNVWVVLANLTRSEISSVREDFQLDNSALEEFQNESKKPQIRVVNGQKFAVALDIKFHDTSTLVTEGVYLFVGRGWLVTLHSEKVDLRTKITALIKQKNVAITESSIDALFYMILANLVQSYEHLLTAIKLTVSEFGQKALFKPSRRMLAYLDSLSRQVIILRRHFWQMRDIINYIKHTEQDKQDIRYLDMVYDDISQLIEMVESYRDTINSTKELYIARVSLQMSHTMRTLTIFSAILLPLTFIASVYGMNGVDLERVADFPIGTVFVAMIMAAVTGVLFIYFKRKQWILSKTYKRINKDGTDESRKGALPTYHTHGKFGSRDAQVSDAPQVAERDQFAEQGLDND